MPSNCGPEKAIMSTSTMVSFTISSRQTMPVDAVTMFCVTMCGEKTLSPSLE